ncbi:type II CRISPR RNA-guided endonuclease Cas9 [Bradyrhizobium sp. URHD0069]|uniref:type II CRISPR RNA-guided endonuclease Cas9 n=1 Tax=Bradyrhizobium sp. URHD0069 TaxID=1380355 RepID=UPI0004965683|nr:type II CRISPR RNA-guided endonuclease Cas9 [Bradyrhizobium sp. URHD0069]
MRIENARSRVGLDVGSNSAGWAAIKLDTDGKPCGLLGLGVRIFGDGIGAGRNPKDGSSLAVQRRVPRGMRRRRDRYLDRRSDLMNALIALGLMPADETERKALEALDPYVLRAKALDAALTPHELGRALFHLGQRRGFKSNRKAGGKEKEDGVISEGIKKLNALLDEHKARTLGEFLYMRHSKGDMVRAWPEAGFYPSRLHYENEFDAIRAVQDKHHALRAEQWHALKDIIFHQRPLKPIDPGWCLLEDGERRAHRALPCAQEFRMLQEVANLRVAPRGEAALPLSKDQRDKVLRALRTQKEVKLDGLLKLLKLPGDTHVNLLGEDRKTLKGDNWKVVSRAPLSAFNTPEAMDKALPDIRDRALRDALIAEWMTFQKSYKPESTDPDDKKRKKNPAMAFADHVAEKGIKLNGRNMKVRRVRMTEELDVVIIKDRKTGKPYKAYKPDGNAFADLYELPDGKWKAVVVRRFDANQSDFDAAKFRPHPAAKKIARLHIGTNQLGCFVIATTWCYHRSSASPPVGLSSVSQPANFGFLRARGACFGWPCRGPPSNMMYAKAVNFRCSQGVTQKYHFRTNGLFARTVVEEVSDRRERRIRSSDFGNVVV